MPAADGRWLSGHIKPSVRPCSQKTSILLFISCSFILGGSEDHRHTHTHTHTHTPTDGQTDKTTHQPWCVLPSRTSSTRTDWRINPTMKRFFLLGSSPVSPPLITDTLPTQPARSSPIPTPTRRPFSAPPCGRAAVITCRPADGPAARVSGGVRGVLVGPGGPVRCGPVVQ